jgi:uncharacterized protein (DUF1697 family)
VPVFVALLRGVNVGRNILRMDRLRALCLELGLQNVRTYVQSGNIVFAAKGSAAQWSTRLEQKLVGECRLPVSVIVRTAGEMARIVAGNPFASEQGIDTKRLHVTFLDGVPTAAAVKALDALPAGHDRFWHVGRDVYLHCPGGYGTTKLSNNAFEKALSCRATSRNWNTVTTLAAMLAE